MHIITDDELAYIKVHPRTSKANEPIIDLTDQVNDRFSISKYWVSITTGKYNQDVTCLINGIKGSGKSNFMLSEGWRCAERTAEILGGQPSDYFSIDNICIMDPESIVEILTKPEKNQIIGLDDSGTINGARSFRTELNQWINKIMITNRPQHNITMMTTPDQGHVDIQAREIGGYYIEMVPNPQFRARGYSILKFFKREKNYRTGKTLSKYMYSHNNKNWHEAKIIRCIVPRAPKWLEDEYDEKREIYMRKIWERCTDEFGSLNDITSQKERKMSKAQIAAQNRAKEAQKAYEELTTTTCLNHQEILKKIGVKKTTWKYWEDNDYVITPPTPNAQPRVPKARIAAEIRAHEAKIRFDTIAATTSLKPTEILSKIGVNVRTWNRWICEGYIPRDSRDTEANK